MTDEGATHRRFRISRPRRRIPFLLQRFLFFVACHYVFRKTTPGFSPHTALALVQQQDSRIFIQSAIAASLDRRQPEQQQQQQQQHGSTKNRGYNKKGTTKHRRGHGRYRYSLENHEEDQKAHLQWMVKTTASILGEDAPPPGKMPQSLVSIMYPLMQAWVRRAGTVRSSKAPHVVERLLQRLLQERNAVNAAETGSQVETSTSAYEHDLSDVDDDDCSESPTNRRVHVHTGVYTAVLEGWSNSREEGSAERAEEILTQMEQIDGLQPSSRSYNAVIKAYVKNGDRNTAAKKAEELLERMEATQSVVARPTQRSYNLLLYSLANAPEGAYEDAAERAQTVLDRMIQRFEKEGPDCDAGPSLNTFNQVIGAWARAKSPDFEEYMMAVYNQLLAWPDVEPDTNSFNTVMGGWLKSESRHALSNIQDVFEEMKKSYESGNDSARPDRISVNTLQVALNRHRRYATDAAGTLLAYEREYDLQPTCLSQNILMDSIIKSGVDDAPEQVMDILARMEDETRQGNKEMMPDHCSYSSVILAYGSYERQETVEKAEEVLSRAWELHRNHGGNAPNVSIYNSVVNAFASMDASESLSRVKGILQEMENGHHSGIPRPDLVTYNTVIKAMRNGNEEDGAVFAENILTTLESIGERDPTLLPDTYSYTSVITAFARSNSPKKAERSVDIVKRMVSAYKNGNKSARISLYTLNAALNACAFVEGSPEDKEKAFDLAMEIDGMRRHLQLKPKEDNTWYGTMLRICSSLLPPSSRREELVERVFLEACESGCVGRLVLGQMQFAATARQYERLLDASPEERIHLRDLPKKWTRNGRDSRPLYRPSSKA